ncbi:uncharacterized protein LOC142977101 [Anticarsia gemmatalis]|uniref:uncharacterized protein LOC142977101 n=1 Tax=Anticarsia gemmatalis TaxID=129554 RepID=UPI003F76D762
MFLPVFLAGLVLILIFVYIVGNNNEKYWKKRGVKFYSKNKVTGVFWDFFTKKGPMFERIGDLYKQYKGEPAVGIGSITTPALFVLHPQNVQHVLQTDFNSFNHRGVNVSDSDKLAQNILFVNGAKWKLLRQSMSPLFTSAKLKNMYYIMDKSAQDFVVYLKEHPKLWEGDCYETLMTFCNAAVCGAIFGISTKSIFDSPFLDFAKRVTAPTLKFNLSLTLLSATPRLASFLGLGLFKEFENFLIGAISNVLKQREEENVKKHDFADICLNIQKKGIMRDSETGCELQPTNELMTAQAMFFMSAGVEPVATSILSAFIQLGRNPDILEKVHREIDETFEKHNGNITYDVITNMEYVDKVLSEAMRINPPVGFVSRKCIKDTVLPVGNIQVDSGTNIFTPIYHIHHDPDIYPNPEVFDPERFAKDNDRSDILYMPFGIGNRMCIGARYSRLQMAAGLVHVLRHFTLKTEELQTELKFKTHFFNVRPISADVLFIPRNIYRYFMGQNNNEVVGDPVKDGETSLTPTTKIGSRPAGDPLQWRAIGKVSAQQISPELSQYHSVSQSSLPVQQLTREPTMFLPVILAGLVLILIFVYIVGNNNEKYWKRRGVKFYSKNKVTGVFWDFFTKKVPMFEIMGDLYKQYKGEPAVGIGSITTPALFVLHPQNVQHVLQTDFNSFNHRGVNASDSDKLAQNILFVNGAKWKLLRQSMSPLFTSAKLKNMYYIMDKSAQDFVVYLKEHPKLWEGDCYETLMTFCNAAVCGAIFGISTKSIFDSPFLDFAKRVTASTLKFNLSLTLLSATPRLASFLGLGLFKEFENFLIGAISNVLKQREEENVKKHDFADICLNIQKKGIMKDSETGCELQPTNELMTAQAMFFMSAGVEPVATSILSAFMQLGRNPDILEKVHREIDATFEKHNGNITFDVITNMEYVDKVLSEAMRINPPLGFVSRKCVKDTVLPVGNIKVDSGTNIFTPIYHIHHDPDIYPNPEVFDPERFAKDNDRSDILYMPFGIGNRMCIGARYSRLQMAAGLVHVLRHFTLKTKQLQTELKFKTHFFNVRPISADVLFLPRNIK